MDSRSKSYLRPKRRSPQIPVFFLFVSIGIVAIAVMAWEVSVRLRKGAVQNTGRASAATMPLADSPHAHADLDQWFEEHEPDPHSVEIIRRESATLKNGTKLLMVRYRHTNAFGGKNVVVEIFQQTDHGLQHCNSETYKAYYVNWSMFRKD